MSWRFRRIYRTGPFRWTWSKRGIGWNWRLPGFRIGISPTGQKYISFGIPGTGFYYINYFKGGQLHWIRTALINIFNFIRSFFPKTLGLTILMVIGCAVLSQMYNECRTYFVSQNLSNQIITSKPVKAKTINQAPALETPPVNTINDATVFENVQKKKYEELERRREEERNIKQQKILEEMKNVDQFVSQFNTVFNRFCVTSNYFRQMLSKNQMDIRNSYQVSDYDAIKDDYSQEIASFEAIDVSSIPDAQVIIDKTILAVTIEQHAFAAFNGNMRPLYQVLNMGGAFWSGLVWNEFSQGLNKDLAESYRIINVEIFGNYFPAFKLAHKNAFTQNVKTNPA